VSKKHNSQIEKLEYNIVNKDRIKAVNENFDSQLKSLQATNDTLRLQSHLTDLHLDRYIQISTMNMIKELCEDAFEKAGEKRTFYLKLDEKY
jgi:hypothetical protein